MNKEKWGVTWKCVKEGTAERISTYDLVKLIFFSGVLFCGAFILDYLDIPSQIIKEIPPIIVFVVLASLLVIIISTLIGLHIFDLFRIVSVNPIDATAFTILLSTLAYSPVRALILGRGVYTDIASLSCIFCFLVILVRFIVHCIKLYQTYSKKSNLIDLKDLLENRFTRIPEKPILLLEKDVDYDLLDRGGITNQLYRSIIHCQPYQSYVISLEGEWGIGKTTIINNTKRLLRENPESNKEYIYIDDFDPWLYGSQEALLLAMLETLIHHSGMRYSPSKFSGIIQGLRETVSNSHPAGSFLYNLLFDSARSGNSVTKLKQRISRYLRTTNKTIVFFIDNLDRANDENVMFLFKLIGIVFDLPRIIYVLSFEKDRINAILEKTSHFDPRFTEKIIQQEIKVPAISEEKAKNLYSTCIINLLEAYDVPTDEIKEFVPTARYIVEKTRNVRSFKRMINSVFPIVFCDDTLLKKSDLLAIEAIHFYNPELFYAIYRNPKFFISHDKNPIVAMKLGFNKKEFNAEGSEFFKGLFSKHKDELELLSDLFPYVRRYEKETELEPNNMFPDPDATQISKHSRICSGKYFDLYFSYSTNNYIAIRKNIEAMIASINKLGKPRADEDLQETAKVIQKALFALKKEDHKEWIERLQSHISDIKKDCLLSVAVSLYALIYYIDESNSMLGFGLDPRSRANYIISLLLQECSEEEFGDFLSFTMQDYSQLHILHSIHYWLSSEKLEQSETRNVRAALLLSQFTDMCNQIIKDNICLYEKDYYHPNNAWGLYHHYKQQDDISGFTSYVVNHLTAENIYRVLWDVTTTSISDHYMYSINEENFKVFVNDTELVDQLVAKRPPQTKDEEFVFRIYETFRNGEPDDWGHKGVTSPTHKDLQL